jgi:hypothetical protein
MEKDEKLQTLLKDIPKKDQMIYLLGYLVLEIEDLKNVMKYRAY